MTGVLGLELPMQVVFGGAVRGLAIGVLAVGIILIYRSSRVVNFALGELGALATVLLVRLVVNWHWNFFVAFAFTVVLAGLVGAALELAIVRRLSKAPRVVLFVATIGAAQLLLFLQFVLPAVARYESFPRAVTASWTVGGVIVRSEHLLVLVVIPLLVAALALFLDRTKYGIAVRASADNVDAARLAGIDVKKLSTLVWAMAGALAAVSAVLMAPLLGASTATAGTVGPGLLLRTLAVALLAGMASLPGAVLAAVALGIGETVLFFNVPGDPGILDAVLLGVVLVAVGVLSVRRRRGAPRESWSFAPRARPVPRRLESVWWVRRIPQIGAALAVALAVVLPLLAGQPSRQYLYSQVLLFALVALSLTVLTGWAGQLSLGQFALVGLGAMTTGALVNARLDFLLAVGVAAVVSALAALVVGTPALRMSGLFLAITTLALAVAAPWLLGRSALVGSDGAVTLLRQDVVTVSLASQRNYYYLCLAALAVAVVVVSRIRRSGIGRSLLAVRENEQAASAMGLSPVRIKLTAFGVSGALAGLAGGFLGGLLVQFEPARFAASESLRVVAVAVIGGLASVTGTVLGAIWVIGLPAFFPGSPEIALLTSGAGLLLLLMYFPGGLVQVLNGVRDVALSALARRMPEPPPDPRPRAVPTGSSADRAPLPPDLETALEVGGLTVRFGARAVLHDVGIHVAPGEVVGLIGGNGAGKSTLMNAIGGFVPSHGAVHILGTDASTLAPHARAALGLGRSFQGAELFGDLSVRETVEVALEARARAGLASVALGLPRAGRLERAKRSQAEEIMTFLGLAGFRERFIGELSTGTRRIVELACLLAVEARVVCLDEPTAGIAQRESEAFGPLLLRLREELDASMLVIEHDMPLVMGISDRIYCLEAGRVISEGPPSVVRDDPAVVASYLGTSETAIARSGAAPTPAAVDGA